MLTSETTKKKGGYRPGAGRHKLAQPNRRFILQLNEAERAQVDALGGTKWAKELILQALAERSTESVDRVISGAKRVLHGEAATNRVLLRS